MASKILKYDPTFEATDEPRVIWLKETKRNFYKYASDNASAYCSTLSPKSGKSYVLVLAMSASEYYGPNRNGDGFAESMVQISHPTWVGKPLVLVSESETLPQHHQSFEQAGNVFSHHVNKDPSAGYGKVIKSFYNWKMHRVELLLEIDNARAADQFFMARLEQGKFPAVSMGCRIKYDVCSICGNKAPTSDDYCNHVNGHDPKFGMNRIIEGGLRCFVWNPSPWLFDLSFVFRPADRIGYTMKKVAYAVKTGSMVLGERVTYLQQQRNALHKIAEIDKRLDMQVLSHGHQDTMDRQAVSMSSDFHAPVSARVCCDAVQTGIPTTIRSMQSLHVEPTARDMFRMICGAHGIPVPIDVERSVGRSQGPLAQVLADMPEIIEQILNTGLLDADAPVCPQTVEKVAQDMPGRALFMDNILRQHVPESYGMPVGTALGLDPEVAYYASTQAPMTYTDEDTGKKFQTNRAAAERADIENKKKLAIEGAGLAGLLGVAHKSITAGKGRVLAPASVIGSAVLGKSVIDGQRVGRVRTDGGEYIPQNTEMVEKRSAVLPALGAGAATTLLMAQDKFDVPVGHTARSIAQSDPLIATAGAGTMYYALHEAAKSLLQRKAKLAHLDATSEVQADLNDLITKIGRVIVDFA